MADEPESGSPTLAGYLGLVAECLDSGLIVFRMVYSRSPNMEIVIMSNLNLNTKTLILEYEGGDTPYMEYTGQKHFVSSGGYLDDGYIGVTSNSLQERFNQHRMDSLKDKIKPTTKYEALLTDLDKELAKDYERQLRPYPNMGWNIRKGGGGMHEGRFFTLYHIYDAQKPPGLTKRFMKWIFRRLKGAIRRTGAARVNPSSGIMRREGRATIPEGEMTFTVGEETPTIPEGETEMMISPEDEMMIFPEGETEMMISPEDIPFWKRSNSS